jgi:hypothetical protein
MTNLVRCHCGCEFWANGRMDYVLQIIRSDRPCPACGGVRFVKLSYPREEVSLSGEEIGDLEADIRPSGGGSVVSVSQIIGIRNVE